MTRRTIHSRVLNVIAAVESIRERHSELRAPAKPRAVWRALAADGIEVRRDRIRRKARSSVFEGDAVITLRSDLSPRAAWKWALHEYGHVRMHFPEHGEYERQLSPCRAGDPREDEATLFALLLALGPEATPDTPEVAALVGRMVAREVEGRRPEQLALQLPERTPEYRPPSERYRHGSHNPDAIRRTPRGQRPPLPGSSIGLGVSHDALLFDWSKEGKPLRYFHLTLGWLDVYDLLAIGEGKDRRIVTLEAGDRRAQRRVFVISSTDRRRYTFKEGEKRDRSPKALDRQIERAERIGEQRSATRRLANDAGALHSVDTDLRGKP